MPIYTYECGVCGEKEERGGVSVDDRDRQVCENCGGTLQRLVDQPGISAPNQNPRNKKYPFFDPGLGKTLHSESERRAEMKKQGVVEAS